MRVTVLAGGIGGARFLLGLRALGHEVTVVGNTGDDVTLWGLRVCPDLDSVMYTLGGGSDTERGWGREKESFRVRDEIAAYAAGGLDVGPTWFGLGDLDLATHLLRSGWLAEGVRLSEVTRRLCARWTPGVNLLPVSDDPIETHVRLADGRLVHFQEWWVRMHAAEPATGFEVVGADRAGALPAVVDAIEAADAVLFAPSNPVVSVGVICAVPGIVEALRGTAAPVVGLSPIIGGAPVRGMADACLTAIGVETAADAVARHYGARPDGLIDGWLVDPADGDLVGGLAADGITARAVPLFMTDIEATAAMAQAALDLAAELRR